MNGPQARRERLRQGREVVSQRDYFQMQMEALEQRLSERIVALEKLLRSELNAIQQARELERVTMNSRLETMNEIRGQLATQRADFVTTDRLEGLLIQGQADRKTFTDKMSALEAQGNATTVLLREQMQKDMDVMRNRTDNDFKTVNADIRSLRESRSQLFGGQTSVRELVGYGIAISAIIFAVLTRR